MAEILSKSAAQTKKLGSDLAKQIISSESVSGQRKTARVLSLVGDLGGGKTTFLQGFAKGLGVKEKILSPTFIIFRKFSLQQGKRQKKNIFENFYHFDCYRIYNPKEIMGLEFRDIVSDSRSIVAIEWADMIKKIIPKDSIMIKFVFINSNTRKIIIKGKTNAK